MRSTTLATVFSVAGIAFANGPSGWPDIQGCVRSTTTAANGNFHMMWVPETGEICDSPQCGGDRAAPNVRQPGCPFYTGTEEFVYTPRYIAGTPWTNGPPGAEATPTSEQAFEETPAVTTPATTPTEAPVEEEEESTKAAEPVITSAPVTSSETEEAGFTIQTKTSVTNSGAAESSVTSSSSTGFETSTSGVKLNGTETTSGAGNATATGGGPAQTADEPDMAAGTWPSAMTALMGAMAVLAAIAI